MSILLSYMFLGLSLSAPIGPINAAQLDKGIKNGFFHAWLLGVGAMMADVAYMLLVYFGLVHFLEFSFVKAFLWLFGTFVLIYTGIESIQGAGQLTISTRTNDESLVKTFFSGFFMSLSNPLTILFWLGIFGSVMAKAANHFTKEQLLINSFAIIVGILIWDFTMASIASIFKRVLSTRALYFISILSGISLIVFGFYFGYQAFQELFMK